MPRRIFCVARGSVLSTLTLIFRLRKIKTEGKVDLFSWMMLGRIFRIAGPSILQQSFVSVGNLFIQRLVNRYGSDIIAAYSAAIKLNTFAITSFTTMANGLSNYVAQNLGAGKEERVPPGFRAGAIMGLCIALPFILLYFVLGEYALTLFLPTEVEDVTAVLAEGMRFLRIISPFYVVVCMKLMADGVFRGSGAMQYFMLAIFVDIILRVLLAYLFALGVNLEVLGIWLSWPVGWIISTALSVGLYWKGAWRHKKLAV